MDSVSILKTVDLFRGLGQDQLTEIGAIVKEMVFREGEIVCRKGDVASSIYIISRGQVAVQLTESDDSDTALLFLGQGQLVGEMTLVDEGRRSASIIAVDPDTRVYQLENVNLMELCQQNTAIGFLIMRNIAQDLSFKLRHQTYTSEFTGDTPS